MSLFNVSIPHSEPRFRNSALGTKASPIRTDTAPERLNSALPIFLPITTYSTIVSTTSFLTFSLNSNHLSLSINMEMIVGTSLSPSYLPDDFAN